ncbi:hypothetical protein [Pseudoalteromonas denitrificans]|uniref:Uncharacterized protein n=1 Tax=Pseudoalteromonas denitrificans DSM 6059 TaxID=1123010 RepID=A0A1I1FFD6_9GAMM|nr:hypothetical protein [Pseudoalteromonas denitrificans]SFB97686.1 hypothetical protein SAMN02745724_00601 [Pseudoalteromonas denitrificans DSM 6059]
MVQINNKMTKFIKAVNFIEKLEKDNLNLTFDELLNVNIDLATKT